jgi:hypothetical protein
VVAPDVRALSTASETVLKGDKETLGYFRKHFVFLKRIDPVNVVATAGLCLDDDRNMPCAVLFDGLRKTNVVTLGLNRDFDIRMISISSDEADLDGARVLTPPPYPATPILPAVYA